MILLLLMFRGLLRLRGTTLAAACLWAMLSALSLTAVAASGVGPSALRFAAVATTFCPLMAVLGAKRPQDKGWQWVVVSLWIVLVWPAGQAVLSRSGANLDLFLAWKLFLGGLIALGPMNYLPTRFWLASLSVALGQSVLLGEYLGAIPASIAGWLPPIGAGCLLFAAIVVSRQCHPAAPPAEDALARHTQQWKDFRDAYGAFWALRILGRVNQTAELRDWPMRLAWPGFETSADAGPTPQHLAELDQTMSTLMRRFI